MKTNIAYFFIKLITSKPPKATNIGHSTGFSINAALVNNDSAEFPALRPCFESYS